ncbi:MAG: geranylgeranylglycerol-phosphate geranylgeranyltransferase [Pyrobaculum sp.]
MSHWRLIRGEHGVLASLASAASYIVTGGRELEAALLLAASTFLAEAALFAHNDVANLEEDRLNRPGAPLVTGAVSLSAAKAVALGSAVLGAVFAYLLGPAPLLIYLTALALGAAYNAKLKRVPLAGNFVVAFLTSMTYIYGMSAAGKYSQVLFLLFASSLAANLGRELVKTAMDYEGDLRAGAKTLAALIGPAKTAAAGSYITTASVPLGVLLAYFSTSSGYYALAAGAAATSALLLYYSAQALRGRWAAYRTGTLVAFSVTLVALLGEALWRLF